MAKRGRPKGHSVSQAERDKIAAGQREAWQERRPWIETSRHILAAANAGDYLQATELLYDYMDPRTSPPRVGPRADPRAGTEEFWHNVSPDWWRDEAEDQWAELDELFAETQRLHDERKRQQDWTDAEISEFRRGMLELSARIRSLMRGDPALVNKRHGPMTVTHDHSHKAHGYPDADDDGKHSHVHMHDHDHDHDHEHPVEFSEMQPGQDSGPGMEVPGTMRIGQTKEQV